MDFKYLLQIIIMNLLDVLSLLQMANNSTIRIKLKLVGKY